MNHRRLVIGIVLAIVFQGVVLVGMVGSSALPLITGTELRLITRPVDPRSMFRGNYARLSYDISTIGAQLASEPDAELRQGEVVYVSLEENAAGIHEAVAIALERPEQGLFIRGRIPFRSFGFATANVSINYGIEAFFAPPEEAIALETSLRTNKAVAEIMVSSSGVARIKAIRERRDGE